MTPAVSRRRPVSACIITRNEAGHIGDCIRSLGFADEVVVVDSLSTDDTVAIAAGLGARVVSQEFLGHVKQKQLAVDLAAHDWVFCIDADERVDSRLADAIEKALAEGSDGDAYEVARHVFYLGRFIDHGGWWPEWRVRLFDRRHGRWTGTDPHDRVEVDGATFRLAGELVHYNYRDLSHHVSKIDQYTTISADRAAERGERATVARLLFRPPLRFFKMYVLKGGFRDGVRGLIVAGMGAFYVFLKYAKRWERRLEGR